jgi:hypothetical protein
LFLTGGWLEALHITCEVAAANPTNKELQETIGEQKIILENIMLLLSFYKESDQNMASLLTDMEELKKSMIRLTSPTPTRNPHLRSSMELWSLRITAQALSK